MPNEDLFIAQIMDKVKDITPIPDVVQKVLLLVDSNEATVDELANTIAVDQAMTARLLKYCNNAYFGYPRQIGTVHKAIIILGFKVIKNIVLTGFMSNFLNKSLKGYSLARGELWRHSLVSACSAQILARYAAPELADNAYTAALLHDIGKVVLEEFVHEQFAEIIEQMQARQLPFHEVEKDVLGISHAEVGAYIAEKWNYPQNLVEAIRYHHQPTASKHNPTLCSLVYMGNTICRMMGIGVGLETIPPFISQEVLKIVRINDDQVETVQLEIKDIMGEISLMIDNS